LNNRNLSKWVKRISPRPLHTEAQNGYVILSFAKPYWVWFLIHKSVTTLS